MVTLINKTKRLKVYNLDHPVFRVRKWGAIKTTVLLTQDTRDGGLQKLERRTFPGSITLRAGEQRTGLPAQIQTVPEIRKAIKRGDLAVLKEAPVEAPEVLAKAPDPQGTTEDISVASEPDNTASTEARSNKPKRAK